MVCSAVVRRCRAVKRAGVAAALCGVGLSGCASLAPAPEPLNFARPQADADTSAAGATAGQSQGQVRRKIGSPYQAGGVWYVPAEQPHYDEVGLASWYGQGFQGRPTADGEIYEMSGVSAAHATLPLPSIVEVTNLENGRRIQVRLNDRGPFHPGRIIDLSVGAAKALGFYQKGTAKVRVRFIREAPLSAPQPGGFTFAFNPLSRWTATTSSGAASSLAAGRALEVEGYYSVQAGAFANLSNAQRAASRLSSAGRAKVQKTVDGRSLYRVVVGPWSDARRAQSVREQVAALGFPGAKVISGA